MSQIDKAKLLEAIKQYIDLCKCGALNAAPYQIIALDARIRRGDFDCKAEPRECSTCNMSGQACSEKPCWRPKPLHCTNPAPCGTRANGECMLGLDEDNPRPKGWKEPISRQQENGCDNCFFSDRYEENDYKHCATCSNDDDGWQPKREGGE